MCREVMVPDAWSVIAQWVELSWVRDLYMWLQWPWNMNIIWTDWLIVQTSSAHYGQSRKLYSACIWQKCDVKPKFDYNTLWLLIHQSFDNKLLLINILCLVIEQKPTWIACTNYIDSLKWAGQRHLSICLNWETYHIKSFVKFVICRRSHFCNHIIFLFNVTHFDIYSVILITFVFILSQLATWQRFYCI